MGEGTKATARERPDRGRGPARFRANGLHQLPCRQWHGGKWTIWTGPHAFDESRHSRLGLMYIIYALVFFVVAGIEASLIRIQLATPNNHFLSPQVFNQLFTMHGTTMVFLVGMPMIFGFANYLVPLMIGARDLAFPRLNAFGFWLSVFGGLLLYFSFIGGQGMTGA